MARSTVEQRGEIRRGRRALGLGCGAAAAVLSVSAFAYLKWANALPPPAPLPARVLPVPNGYHARIEAADELEALDQSTEKWRPPWRADLGTLRRALARRGDAMDRLRSALRKPYYTLAFEPSDVDDVCPSYGSAFWLFWGEARVARADGRYADAMSASLDAIELGVKMGRGGPLLHCLQGQNSQWGVDAGERVVASLTAAEARAAGRRLDHILAEAPSFAAAMEHQRPVELAKVRNELLHPPPWSQPAPGSLLPLPQANELWSSLVHWLHPKSLTYRWMDQHYRRFVEVARQPYAKRRFQASGRGVDRVMGGPLLWISYDQPLRVEHISYEFAENEAFLRLLRVRLALQEYRKTHHRWPSTLEEAASGLDRDALTDPFTNLPLRYQQEGARYTLYSVGPDLKDDGGKPLDPKGADHESIGDLVSGRHPRVREGGVRR